MDKIIDKTKQFYDTYYNNYFDKTKDIIINKAVDNFLVYIKRNEIILDLGCGSGNHLKYFMSNSYNAIGIDYSKNLCELARQFSKANVYCLDFSNIDELNKFIVKNNIVHIFASASLLHLTKKQFIYFMSNINFHGIMYFSLKEGISEGFDDQNRFFSYYKKEEVERIIKNRFLILSFFYEIDKSGRENKWLNWVITIRKNLHS